MVLSLAMVPDLGSTIKADKYCTSYLVRLERLGERYELPNLVWNGVSLSPGADTSNFRVMFK